MTAIDLRQAGLETGWMMSAPLPLVAPLADDALLAWRNTRLLPGRAAPAPGWPDAPGMAAAQAAIRAWDGYAPTPLHALPATAARLGLGALWCKDEGSRFGLGSFKALGAPYAVQRLLEGRDPVNTTLASCTDGNHGRALAWAARRLGARCVIGIPRGVSENRIAAIAALGAEILRIDLPYDDAFAALRAKAAIEGWVVVSDFGVTGDEDAARHCMAGYTLMMAEALDQLGTELPTHVFVQGGCGGFAAAMLAALHDRYGTARPFFTVIEPARAACLLEAARANTFVRITGDLETLMGGLSCGVISSAAWPWVVGGADAFLVLPERFVAPGLRLHARPPGDDPRIVAGETAAAGLGTLLALADDAAARTTLRLDATSRVLIFACEGATDPDSWHAIAAG
jgi:diaminopropionate ammonia-lyase